MEEKKIKILYVDDEPHNLNTLKANLRIDYEVYTALSAADGLKILEGNKIDIVITDQRMPEVTGVQFLEQVLNLYPDTMRIIFTAYSDIEVIIAAINKGQVYRYLIKPSGVAEIRVAIESAYEVRRLREENKVLIQNLFEANMQLEFMLRQRLLSDDLPDEDL